MSKLLYEIKKDFWQWVSDKKEMKLYQENRLDYSEQYKDGSFSLDSRYDYPILYDRYGQAGEVDQCFWMDLWAAQLVYKNNPMEHWDIGGQLKDL